MIHRCGKSETAPGPPEQPAEVEKRTWCGQSFNVRGEHWFFLHYSGQPELATEQAQQKPDPEMGHVGLHSP